MEFAETHVVEGHYFVGNPDRGLAAEFGTVSLEPYQVLDGVMSQGCLLLAVAFWMV